MTNDNKKMPKHVKSHDFFAYSHFQALLKIKTITHTENNIK